MIIGQPACQRPPGHPGRDAEAVAPVPVPVWPSLLVRIAMRLLRETHPATTMISRENTTEVDVLVNNLGIAPLGKTKVERLRRRHRGFVGDDLTERLLSFSREWNERIPAAGR